MAVAPIIGDVQTKDPDATLDWTLDFNASADNGGPWLPSGDTVSSVVWTIYAEDGTSVPGTDSTPLAVASSPVKSNTTTTATAYFEAGTAGNTYLVTCTLTTADGRIDDFSFKMKIVEK